MNTTIMILAAVLIGDAPKEGEIRKDYDKIADFTSWVCTVGCVWKPMPESEEKISFALASKPAKGPRWIPQSGSERVFIDVSYYGNKPRFQKSRRIFVKIDEDKPIDLGSPALLSESIGGAPYYEDFTVQLPLKTLESIASARRIEFIIDGVKIVPSTEQLQLIGKFAKRLRQADEEANREDSNN